MALQTGLTFGMTKADIATVVANGVPADDPRVLARTNEAIQLILLKMIPVNAMATYDVVGSGDAGDELFLPPELENAVEVEVLNGARVRDQLDVTQGWSLVSGMSYVDPASAHDNALQDLFLQRDPSDHSVLRRKYRYHGLASGATVRVTGKKRYIPITSDGDSLIVQNIPAVKLVILSREFLDRGPGSIDDSEKMWLKAIRDLEDEVKGHQLDPTNSLKRKAAYQDDLIGFAEGTLGRTRARLALELPGFLNRGKSEITYLVNRAVQMLVDNRNQLAITGRISVHGSVMELAYTPANTATTVLAWPDYNQIRLMIQGFITEGPDPQALAVAKEYEKQAFDLQRAQLIEATEYARHSKYTTDLGVYVPGTFGWTVARLALEMPGGLAMTTTELERLVSMTEMRAMERGIFKGCLKTLTASITGGDVLFPRDVEAVLAADICGNPIDIRSIYFPFQKNGPGFTYEGCQSMFRDAGEVYFNQTGAKRRKYFYTGSTTSSVELKAVCKLRWTQLDPCDEMRIKNFEAIRLFAEGIKGDNRDKMREATDVLEREMMEYLGGISWTPNVDMENFGFASCNHGPL